MGLNLSLIKQVASKLRYIPVHSNVPKYLGVTNPRFWNGTGEAGFVHFSGVVAEKTLNKAQILSKYALECGFVEKDLVKAFGEVEKYLDEISVQRLLKLTKEGKIKLYEQPKVQLKRKRFDFDIERELTDNPAGSILKCLKKSNSGEINESNISLLKKLLALEEEGKLPANNISELLKLNNNVYDEEMATLVSAIKEGKVHNGNLFQARLLTEHGFSINLLNAKTIDNLSQSELKDLANLLASKSTNRKLADGVRLQRFKDKICELDTPILPKDLSKRTELLTQVSKRLTSLVKVNTVPESISKRFLNEFDNVSKVFAGSKYSIDDLVRAGGIKLAYSRENFKQNILKQIEHLPETEQQRILSKFGLANAGAKDLSGLPVHIDSKNLSQIENNINNEINKFLNQNEILLPKGFEEFKPALNQICEVFPEFKFSIGSIQHDVHSKDLAGHILMAFQENMRNPLYKTLNAEDKRILGVATLLHDINKVEHIVDEMHPLTSSQTANAIVNRMGELTNAEKNRIINFVENHHWLTQIKNGKDYSPEMIDELAYTFRKGNDFTMAKIFAESDLKAVNKKFYTQFGGKINSNTVKEIENRIVQIQSNGKLIYTADITLDRAITLGAKKQVLGEGELATENWVISAKDLGLESENVLYHAPGKSDAFILAESGMGYGNEGVLSCSLGRAGHSATFQNRKEFILFRKTDMDNICLVSTKNADSGAEKSYHMAKKWILSGSSYGSKVRNAYQELTSKIISEKEYAKLYRIASNPNMKLTDIHSNKQIQAILGGEKEAKAFEDSISKINETFVSCEKTSGKGFVPEIVVQDLEVAAIGTNRKATEIDYQIRKRYPLIVEF